MDLFQLVKLQSFDKRLMELEAVKGDLPETVKRLEITLSVHSGKLSSSKAELEQIQKDQRDNIAENDDLYDSLIKYQEQVYSVKTNKEYDAITVEIENIENKISANESQNAEIITQEHKITAEIEELEQQVTDLEKKLSEKKIKLQEKMVQTETEEKQLLNNREQTAGNIGRRLLYNYNRIRNGKNGIALAEIHNYTCDGCYATIPAQKVVEVREMDQIILCETCGRILVSTNNKVKDAVEA